MVGPRSALALSAATRATWVSQLARSAATLAAAALLATLPAVAHATPEEAAAAVRQELARVGPELGADRALVERLYAVRAHAPLWLVDGSPNQRAHDLAAALTDAATHGLDPRDYDAARVAARVAELTARPAASIAAIARIDVALAASAARFLHDLALGRIDPAVVGTDYDQSGKRTRFATLLDELAGGTPLPTVLVDAAPPFAERVLLERKLARYRALAADATLAPVAIASKVRPGDRFAEAPRLARWLAALGDLAADVPVAAGRYDETLVAAVQHFQARHGLAPDGLIGAGTAAALATPATTRVRQIELALERLRWLPILPRDRTVIVNVPGFEAMAFDAIGAGRAPALRMSIVAGKALRTETPFFARPMTRVVFAPYWNVPTNILRNEELPKIRRNPGWLASEQMEIVADGRVLAPTPDAIARLAHGTAELRQRPGEKNALGAVKFLFPNPYDVYMHDTPARELFGRARRDFSHGCIRLGDAAAMAHWVLGGDGVASERIDELLASTTQTIVPLHRPIMVVIAYATAVAELDGTIAFYDDVYGHDAELAAALAARPHPPTLLAGP